MGHGGQFFNDLCAGLCTENHQTPRGQLAVIGRAQGQFQQGFKVFTLGRRGRQLLGRSRAARGQTMKQLFGADGQGKVRRLSVGHTT